MRRPRAINRKLQELRRVCRQELHVAHVPGESPTDALISGSGQEVLVVVVQTYSVAQSTENALVVVDVVDVEAWKCGQHPTRRWAETRLSAT